MASRTANDAVGVLLGEAVSGNINERFADMVNIASAIANRAKATGRSIQSIISAKNQFSSFGKPVPKGSEIFEGLAKAAWDHVERFGPTHTGTYFATPAAVANLPKGLRAVTASRGHIFFSDPKNRAIRTSFGYVTPSVDDQDRVTRPAASPRTALDAMLGPATAPQSSTEAGSAFTNPLGYADMDVKSNFGPRRSPMGIGSRNHQGVDLSLGDAGSPAEATAPGTVTFAGRMGGYGNTVEVTHPNGMVSRYSHLQDINVKQGQTIARGTPVGIVGMTGTATGPHLHFEVRDQAGRAVNPAALMSLASRPVPTPSPRPSQATPPAIDMARFGGQAMPDPARFAGPALFAPAAPVSPAPAATRTGFGGLPGMPGARYSASSGVPGSAYASLFSPQAATMPGGATANRFSSTPDAQRLNVDRFQGPVSMPVSPAEGFNSAIAGVAAKTDRLARPEPSVAAPLGGIYTPADGFASVTGEPQVAAKQDRLSPAPAAPPARSFAELTTGRPPGLTRADAGTMGTATAPPRNVTTAPASLGDVGPIGTAIDSVLSQGAATPNMVDPIAGMNAFAPVDTPLMPEALQMALAPEETIAPPAPALPAPRVVRDMPVAGTWAPDQTVTPPAFTAADVYSGAATSGLASDGSTVSRDPFGRVSVTNKYGATTTQGPFGNSVSWSGPPGANDPWDGMRSDGGLFGGLGSALGGLVSSPRAADIAKDVTGSVIGGGLGSMIAGPIGGLIGAAIGRNMMNDGKSFGGLGGLGGMSGTSRSGSPNRSPGRSPTGRSDTVGR